jgi:hypothetical protein
MAERPKLGQLLLSAGAIDEGQLTAALTLQQQRGLPLGFLLVEQGVIDEETLVRTLARQHNLPVAWLRGKQVRREVLDLVPKDLVARHRCLPVLLDEQGAHPTLMLATSDPSNLHALDEAALAAGIAVRPVLAAASELEEAIARHFPGLDSRDAGVVAPLPPLADMPDLGAQPELLRMAREAECESSGTEPAPEDDPTMGSVGPDVILRALSQLLVEKGLIDRHELVRRLGELSGREASVEA